MLLLAAEPRCTGGFLLPCQYLCGTILVTLYYMVWGLAALKSRAGAGVFGLMGCYLLSPSLAFRTFFNNNNDNS